MIDKATSPANIQSMLQTLRSYQAQAGESASIPSIEGKAPVGKTSFTELVQNAVGQVNDAQLQSRALQDSYDRGENVPLTDVVLGMQKSSIAFEATLQVRNKVLKAYEEMLNMPV